MEVIFWALAAIMVAALLYALFVAVAITYRVIKAMDDDKFKRR